MSFTFSGPRRQKWVGSPVPAPRGDRGRSPSARQRHYGSAELSGTGERVYVDDVVEVSTEESTSNAAPQPRLAQVQSMWEDTFTAACKFRARWLMRVSDLPEDASRRLRKSRQDSALDKKDKPPPEKVEQKDEADVEDEVFLTPRTEDLELRLILKPATLSVLMNEEGEAPPEREGKVGPRLSHTFCPSSGEFAVLPDGDAILARARARQADAAAAAAAAAVSSGSDKEGSSAKRGPTTDGWLPQKGKSLATRGRGRGRGRASGRGSVTGRGGSRTRVSNSRSQSPTNLPEQDVSEESEPGPDPDDEPWEEGDDGVTDSDSDADFESSYGSVNVSPKASKNEETEPKKTLRHKRPQRSSGASENEPTVEGATDGGETPRGSSTNAQQMPRRPRAPAIRRQGPLPPRPRRLAMPPAVIQGIPRGLASSGSRISTICVSRASPTKTRLSTVGKDRDSPSQSSPTGTDTDAERPPNKRRRSLAPGKTLAMGPSDCPPRRTPVGKEYQAEIPDLLPPDKRKPSPPTGDGARTVWRSARDWDPRSRDKLEEYIRAVKTIVEVKQARPGVAVHVRLGGTDAAGVDESGRTCRSGSNAGSYAIWAITAAGRDAAGDVRVGCSERAQTVVPRSAIQRVSCEEEALTGLVKTRSLLNNFTSALQMFAKDSNTPQSIQPWTFTQDGPLCAGCVDVLREKNRRFHEELCVPRVLQVRTLEKALEDEFDPDRRVHGWARPGMSMDREDFIDLAKVSKSVPGKNSEQVLAFYYKYLAAAEPLTDVLFGKESAEARKSEPLGDNFESSSPLWNGRPPRDNDTYDTRQRPALRQAPAPSSGRSSSPGGSDTNSPPGPQGLVSRASASKFPRDGEVSTIRRGPPPLDGPAPGGHVQGDEAVPVRPVYSSSGRSGRSFGEGFSERSSRPRGDWNSVDARFRQEEEGWRGGPHSPHNGVSGAVGRRGEEEGDLHSSVQRPRRLREDSRPRAPPPGAEVLEVLDEESGDEGVSRGVGVGVGDSGPMPRGTKNNRPHGASSTQPWGPPATGEDWDPRGIRHGTEDSTIASRQLPSGILSIPPRPGGSVPGSSGHARPIHPSQTPPYAYTREKESGGFFHERAGARWERSQHPPSSRAYGASHTDARYQGEFFGGREWGGTGGNGQWVPRSYSGGSGRGKDDARGGNGGGGSSGGYVDGGRASYDSTSAEAKFGHMAPCWRLLEKARAYMEENQLRYMSGLIQTHVKKPMTREQLLERAKSCLQEQVQIFNAFVKMFDRIEEPPAVPFYPSAKHPVDSSSPSSAHSGRQIPRDAPPGRKEGASPVLRVPPAPALAVEVSGVASRFANPASGVGGGSGGRGLGRVPSMASGTRQGSFVAGHQSRGDAHPRSAMQHARGVNDHWGPGAGAGSAEGPVYPHRSPSGPMGSYGGGTGGSNGNAASGHASSAPPGVVRGDQGFSNSGRGGSRGSWSLAARQDSRAAGSSKSSTTEGAAGGAGSPGSPRAGPLRAYPGVRFESQQPRWRSDAIHESPAAAAAADAAVGSRSMSGRGHWGSGGGPNSWK